MLWLLLLLLLLLLLWLWLTLGLGWCRTEERYLESGFASLVRWRHWAWKYANIDDDAKWKITAAHRVTCMYTGYRPRVRVRLRRGIGRVGVCWSGRSLSERRRWSTLSGGLLRRYWAWTTMPPRSRR